MSNAESALEHIKQIHQPMCGEAYPQDKKIYCRVCIANDGGSRHWPCPTIKIAEKALKSKKVGKCWMCTQGDSVPLWNSSDGFHYHGKSRCKAFKSTPKNPGHSAGGQNAAKLRPGWKKIKTSCLTAGELIEKINRSLKKRVAQGYENEHLDWIREQIQEWYS